MNPLAVQVVQALIMYGPDVAKAVVELFHKADPTKADYDALFAKATQKSYDDYMADARARAIPVALSPAPPA